MNILLTGGTGYIGSHAAVSLIQEGHNVVLLDNLINSDENILKALNKITKSEVSFIHGDIADQELICNILKSNQIDTVIHFAGLKSVAESVKNPIRYFKNNVLGTISLLDSMEKAGVNNLVFSGSATVYGNPMYLPIDESHSLDANNPYGRTKQQIEEILQSIASSNPSWKIVTLRYFNPIGAHPSGLIGENISGMPNNIMPLICKVALKQLDQLNVYGNDYETKDGTGVRDYIDIMDLIDGHISALKFIHSPKIKAMKELDGDVENYHTFNLGTGHGYSVLELIHAFEEVSGMKISYKFEDRRPGDIAENYAKIEKANKILKWNSKRTLHDMCSTSWKFISYMNPK